MGRPPPAGQSRAAASFVVTVRPGAADDERQPHAPAPLRGDPQLRPPLAVPRAEHAPALTQLVGLRRRG